MMNYRFQGDPAAHLSGSPYSFELEEGTGSLRIQATPPPNGLLQWILFNPSGRLQGQGFHLQEGKTLHITPGKFIPYGAADSSLEKGRWTVWVICVAPLPENGVSLPWQMDIGCSREPNYPSAEADEGTDTEGPAFFWMDSSTDRIGDYGSKCFRPGAAWYRGDLHVHTTCSDGKMPPSRVAREAQSQGLDFYAVTDHNFFHTGWTDTSIPVLPGMELTLDKGHFNLFPRHSLPHLQERFWAQPAGYSDAPAAYLRNADAFISVNHPFMTPWEVREEDLDVTLLHGMEIICDPLWSTSGDATEKALQAFGYLWNRGIRLTGIGGSDLHNPPEEPYEGSHEGNRIGTPSTWVFAKELSVQALLEGLYQQKVYVSMGFTLDFSAECGGALFEIGSRLPVTEASILTFTFCITSTDPAGSGNYYAEVVENTGITERLSVSANRPVRFRRCWDGGYHWLRMDIRDHRGRLCGFTNPFHAGEKEIETTNWRNLLELIRETKEKHPGNPV